MRRYSPHELINSGSDNVAAGFFALEIQKRSESQRRSRGAGGPLAGLTGRRMGRQRERPRVALPLCAAAEPLAVGEALVLASVASVGALAAWLLVTSKNKLSNSEESGTSSAFAALRRKRHLAEMPGVADDQQTRLSMGTHMTSSAGSALQSLMSKPGGAKGTKGSGAGGSQNQAGGSPGTAPPMAARSKATDQKTVVSSATQLNASSKAGALLSSLVQKPGNAQASSGAATKSVEGRETAKPTHSDRALEEAEAKVPLLGSDVTAPTIGIAIGTQVVDRGVSPWGTACDGARALSVIGAVFIVLLLAVIAGVVFLVKPHGTEPSTQQLRKGTPEARREHAHDAHASMPRTAVSSEESHRQHRISTSHPQIIAASHSQRVSTSQPQVQRSEPRPKLQPKKEAKSAKVEVPPFSTRIGEAEHVGNFNCNEDEESHLRYWSAEHVEYCCVNADIGCDVLPAAGECDSPDALTDWSSWADTCNKCGGGVKTRRRRFAADYSHCEVSQQSRRVKFLDTMPCHEASVEEFVSAWSGWGDCSVTCDDGYRERVREMTPLALECRLEFPLRETTPCSRPSCRF
ncbi:Spondin-1 [Symbiodinium microadriaticum]|uniref:Spondin-1 n=1 Tax=Symbiodinium microadriaticum TaxID=2951 RepID=A0A1Q9DB30_SYMMI|nr:Spondin-1 [Symbiodinium microadriaticum]